jgi:hypothetical protein
MLDALRGTRAWFGSAAQVVEWFRRRRSIRFEAVGRSGAVRLSSRGEELLPPVAIRVHRPWRGKASTTFADFSWNGRSAITLDPTEGRIVPDDERPLLCAAQ